MIKKKIIRKLFNTTLSLLIILSVLTIQKTNINNKVLRTNLEIEDITNIKTDNIYLLNKDNLLVKTSIYIDNCNLNKKIVKIINYLKESNNKIPISLKGYINDKTEVLDIKIDNDILSINLSKDFLNTNNEKLIISGLVYSLLELDNINGIKLYVENTKIKGYENILNKNIGINNIYDFTNRKDINKVVIYYIDEEIDNSYYVPINKYLNDNREKIEVIIDELKSTNNNLISYLNNNVELLNYKEEGNILLLNFNKYIKETNKTYEERLLNEISYSVFDNYDVTMVIFQIDGNNYKEVFKYNNNRYKK